MLYGPAREVPDALVAEADAEDRLAELLQDRLAKPEVAPPFRPARPGREDDGVEVQLAELALRESVVIDHDRIDSGRRGNQLYQIVGKDCPNCR